MNEGEARDGEAEERRIAAPLAAALFQEHADWLRRYVRRLADNRSLPPSLLDPDDVVQEAFVQLLRHNWAEPIRNPGAWLCVVVRNQVTKAAQQHRHFIDDDPAAHIEVGTAGWSSVPRQASTEEIQAARAAVDAIARLPGNQQVATYLAAALPAGPADPRPGPPRIPEHPPDAPRSGQRAETRQTRPRPSARIEKPPPGHPPRRRQNRQADRTQEETAGRQVK